ncbi:hypothetical protein EMIT0162MI3_20424 [Pseudomonas chlororaphis]
MCRFRSRSAQGRSSESIPAQRAASLILDHPSLEEVLLFLQVHDFAHPWERVGGAWVFFFQANLRQATVSDELEVVLHHRRVHAQYAARHGVASVFDFQLGALEDHLGGFFLHLGIPQVRVFDLDLVDHVDTEVQVHGFVAQDVLELLGDAGHFVATAHGQDLGEAAVEEDAFQNAVVGDQVAQQLFVGVDGAGFELRIGDRTGVLQAPGRFLRDRWNLVVHVEDLAFIHGQRFDAVLVGVGVDRLFERLAQDVLAAFRVGDQAVHGQHQVVGNQGVGGGEEAQVAHHDAALVVGQAFRVFPEGDVGGHVDFLRHPVVCATVQVLLPGPVIFEWHELVEVGAAVDHALFIDGDTGGSTFQLGQAFGDVELVQRGLGTGNGSRIIGGYGAGFESGGTTGAVEFVHGSFGSVAGVGAFNGDFAFFFVEFVPAQHDVSSPA